MRALTGRERELAELLAALREASNGRSRFAVVSGPAGVGKTALLETLSDHAVDSGVGVHWARCFEFGGAPPMWPWTQLVRSIATTQRLRSGLDEAALGAATALGDAGVADVAHDRRPPAEASDESRFRLFDGAARLLAATTTEQPALLVVEDVHAADTASLELMQFVAAQPPVGGRYLLVTSSRDGDGAQSPLGTAADRIELHGLRREAVASLVTEVAGRAVSDDVVAAIHDATAGNPLFITTLTRHLERSGRVEDAVGARRVPVPSTVRDVLERRFRLVDPSHLERLALLAAAGRDVEPEVAAQLLGDELDAVVDTGVAERMLERRSAGRLRFAHSLVQSALLDRMPAQGREDVHRRVATVLEELKGESGPHLATLAHHYARAGRSAARKALEYTVSAAAEAHGMGAFAEAAQLYEQALEVAAQAGATDGQVAEVMASLGDVRMRLGHLDAGRRACVEAWEAAKRSRSPRVMAEAALSHARFADGGVVNHESVRLISGALAEIGSGDHGVRARLRARLASELASGPPDETRELLAEEAAAEALATGDAGVIFAALRFAQSAIAMPDRVATCLEWSTSAIEAAEAMDDVAAKAEMLAFRSVHHLTRGEVDGYTADSAALAQLAQQVRTPLAQWHATVAAGCRSLLDGRFDDAAGHVAHSLTFASAVPNALGSWQFQEFSLAWERGDISTFESTLNAVIELRPGLSLMARCAIALVHATTGRTEQAAARLAELTDELAKRRVPWVWLLSAGWLAEATVVVGDREAAARLSRVLEPHGHLHVIGATGTVACYWGSVARHLGNLALVAGDVEAGARHLEDALLAHVRIGSVPFTARSQLELAGALRRRGAGSDAARAERLEAEAAATASSIGMTNLVSLDVGTPAQESRSGTLRRPRIVREGDYWTIEGTGRAIRLRHSKGVQYLAALLRSPGREVHSLHLTGRAEQVADVGGDDVLDAEARTAYRQRLIDLEEDIADAEAAADIGRLGGLREERDFLLEELQRALGMGNRSRVLGTPPREAARIAVTKAIRGVLKKIENSDPDLGRHLRATIRTGTYCGYVADVEACLDWEVVGMDTGSASR